MNSTIPGTQGYAEQVDLLTERYEAVPFERKNRHMLHLLPDKCGSVLDVGAGTDADAAWFAAQGHSVVAPEQGFAVVMLCAVCRVLCGCICTFKRALALPRLALALQ